MHVLIIKTSSLGDVIQTFPVVEYLKQRDPSCHIDWLVEEEYVSLLSSLPGLNRVIGISTRQWKKQWFRTDIWQQVSKAIREIQNKTYDLILDLQGNTKSALCTFFAKAKTKIGFGWNSVAEWPAYFAYHQTIETDLSLPIQKRYYSLVQQFFHDDLLFEPKEVYLKLTKEEEETLASYSKADCKQILVAFGSKWENKKLSFCTWKEILQNIYDQQKAILYFPCLTEEEKWFAKEMAHFFPKASMLPCYSFALLQHVIRKMDLVLAVDSALLALCGTTSTPVLSLFGPTKGSVYQPVGKQNLFVQGVCPYGISFVARCPRLRSCKTGACLKNINVAKVAALFLNTD